jgi:DNA-binding LacI/PurR family transcriptional regulator
MASAFSTASSAVRQVSEIAVAAGVSITTVSRTMRRLRDTVVELGYRKPA